MTSDDLDLEWATARAEFAWADFDALLKAGVPKASLASALAADLLGAADIVPKSGLWQRLFRGERAVVIPVPTPAGELADLVAFSPGSPRSFWRMSGLGFLLGHESLERALHFGTPLAIRECPMDWLSAECDGAVILDWSHYWPAYFGGLVALQFDDAQFARKTTSLMRRPLPVPPALVPSP